MALVDSLVVVRFPSREYAICYLPGPPPFRAFCIPVVHAGERKIVVGLTADGLLLESTPGTPGVDQEPVSFEDVSLDLSHDMGFIYGLRWLVRYGHIDKRMLNGMGTRWLKGERSQSDTKKVHELLARHWHPKAPA